MADTETRKPDPSSTAIDAGVQRLLLWVGPGRVSHDLLVRSIRLVAERVMPLFN